MSDSSLDFSQNAAATERLRNIVAQLEEADLSRSLGGAWTVGFALVHLAFWDARQVAALQRFARGDGFPSEDIATNATLAAIASALDPTTVGEVAVSAAQELDALVETLTTEQLDSLRDAGKWYAIERSPHREEHLQQIEDAIA